MEITVKDLMKIGPLKTSQVVAGFQNMDRVVKGITIIEAPDIVNWLSGGEILLTSLYSVSGEPMNYREFAEKLAAKEVSALAIKIGRFIEAIPQEILEAGNEFGLPIIELDANVRFIDIMYPVMEELFNSQVIKLKYYKDVQERFTMLALQCEGLDEILRTLEELVGNPVAVFDKNFKVINSTDDRIKMFDEIKEAEDRENLNEKFSYYRRTVHFPEMGEEPLSQIVVPIQALSQIRAYLTVAEVNKQLQEMDFISIEHAATVVTLDMVKRFAVREVEQKFKNDLIERLITGEAGAGNTLDRVNLMDWDLNRPFHIVLFHAKNMDQYLAENRNQNRMFLQSVLSELTALVSGVLKTYTKDYIIGNKGDTLIVLWPVLETEDKALSQIKRAGKDAQELVKRRLKKLSLQVGIGDVAADLDEIPRSYKEAQDAMTYGEMIPEVDSVVAFSELGVFRILCKFAERNSLTEFIPKPLLKLMEYDQKNDSDFLKTLEVFLECNGNASKAAKTLFIHYKTILYRLERIKEVTHFDLENNQNRLELEMGLKMIRLMGSVKG